MSRVSFTAGVGVAALVAGGSAAAHSALSLLVAPANAFAITMTLAAGSWGAWLVARGSTKSGRAVVPLAWCLAATVLWAAAPTPLALVAAHAVLLWLLRVLFHHHGVLAGIADLGLSALALGAAVVAFRHSGSLLLACWSFFLVQASFAYLLPRQGRPDPPQDALVRARAQAAAALARLERGA